MAPPSARTLWIRIAAVLAIGGWLMLAPVPKQIFGEGGRAAPRWRMFSDVGTTVCAVTYRAGSEVLDRSAIIQPGGSPKFPATGRLKSAHVYEVRTRQLCLELGKPTGLNADLTCPGRKVREETRDNVCGEQE